MPPISALAPQGVLIFKADRYSAHVMRDKVQRELPAARVVLAHRLSDATAIVAGENPGWLISGTSAPDGDALELLAAFACSEDRARRAWVVTGTRHPHVLAVLSALPIGGIFDTRTEQTGYFAPALRCVLAGEGYWSAEIVRLFGVLRAQPEFAARHLTPTERLVFALIGDGSDNAAAADVLQLAPSTVQGVRRSLHRKLRVAKAGDLVRLAVQLGFVQLTEEGTVRPGYSLLLADWQDRKRRPAVAGDDPAAAMA